MRTHNGLGCVTVVALVVLSFGCMSQSNKEKPSFYVVGTIEWDGTNASRKLFWERKLIDPERDSSFLSSLVTDTNNVLQIHVNGQIPVGPLFLELAEIRLWWRGYMTVSLSQISSSPESIWWVEMRFPDQHAMRYCVAIKTNGVYVSGRDLLP